MNKVNEMKIDLSRTSPRSCIIPCLKTIVVVDSFRSRFLFDCHGSIFSN